LWCWGLNSGPTPQAITPALSLWWIFRGRVSWSICLGWFQTQSSWFLPSEDYRHEPPVPSWMAILFLQVKTTGLSFSEELLTCWIAKKVKEQSYILQFVLHLSGWFYAPKMSNWLSIFSLNFLSLLTMLFLCLKKNPHHFPYTSLTFASNRSPVNTVFIWVTITRFINLYTVLPKGRGLARRH
jgi:hypothetical protein